MYVFCLSVYVCVCVKEREREIVREREFVGNMKVINVEKKDLEFLQERQMQTQMSVKT